MSTAWSPPPYQIRVSRRARNVNLRLCIHKGLEVVVPQGFNKRKVPELLYQRRDWLDSALKRINKRRSALTEKYGDRCPDNIVFPAVDLQWSVCYETDINKPPRLLKAGANLIKIRCHDRETDTVPLLQDWLKKQARQTLVPWLRQTAREHGFHFQRTAIRAQKTRWASCASTGTISLNSRLLFLPPEMVRYVFIHELCHTRHMNHSARFWSLVEQHMPDYLRYEKALDKSWHYIPLWAVAPE